MIKVQDLSKRFGAKVAVDHVTFAVEKGEVLGFLGPNGAGKSTTMRMITGFIQPDGGSVTIGGCNIETDQVGAKSKIGYLPENAPSYPDMTVEGFLKFAATIRGLAGAARRTAVEQAIETCSLAPVRRQTIETLSKGYRHRACFAQAIIHDPEVLVFDEPTDGLDPNQKHEMRNLIRRMGERKAIILSTHILEEVDAVCTRVIIIDKGKLVANGLPAELRARAKQAGAVVVRLPGRTAADVTDRLSRVDGAGRVQVVAEQGGACTLRVLPKNENTRDELALRVHESCLQAGWQVAELHTEEGRLDEVFRAITTSEGGAR